MAALLQNIFQRFWDKVLLPMVPGRCPHRPEHLPLGRCPHRPELLKSIHYFLCSKKAYIKQFTACFFTTLPLTLGRCPHRPEHFKSIHYIRSGKYPFLKQLTACFFTAFVFISCTDEELSSYNSKNLGIEEIKNADINYTLGGNAKAKLRSSLMLRVQDVNPYVEFPQKLHVDFFNVKGEVESRLDAFYGKYFELESKVFLKDSVRVINILGDTLYCNELWWDRNRKGREFYTDKPVKIRRKMEIINGTGMEAAQDFKNWVILNPSQGVMRIPNSQFPVN